MITTLRSRALLVVGALAATVGTVVPTVVAGAAPAASAPVPVVQAQTPPVLYPTVQGARAERAGRAAAVAAPLTYHGGTAGIGVTTGNPKVYLVFWGSQWGTASPTGSTNFSNDPSGLAPREVALAGGYGSSSELWSGVLTQYCEGVTTGSSTCTTGAPRVGYPTGGSLAGTWNDIGTAVPTTATQTQIGQEALNAAAHFGNTTQASNRSVQYVIVSPTGTHPGGFNTTSGNFCAWHSGVNGSPYGWVAYTNLPYIPDMGSSCGANYVNGGTTGALDGATIVEGHEYAETVTDQIPNGGWLDSSGAENGDKCAWVGTGGTGGAQNVAFGTGTFAMQATWSNEAGACAIARQASALPAAPTIGTAVAGNGSASLSWTAPSSTGGALSGYVVTPFVAGVAQAKQTFSSTATTQTITGLANGTTYTFTVAATNAMGTGASSAASNAVTPATLPGAPTIGTATAGNASAVVTWSAPASSGGSAITGYVVTPYIGSVAQAAQTFVSTATTETVTGLANGTAYTFTVAAINGVGTGAASAASNTVTPAAVPTAPTIGSATGADSSAVVTWSVPGSDGGSAITGYVVTPYIGSVAQAAQTFVSTATTETVTGLANGTTYTFTVAAINGVGTGAASAASNAVTPAAVPTAPTIGSATGADSSAVVTWSVPGSDGGSAITGYVVTPYIGSVAQAAQTFVSTATTETVTGLANGTAYTFTVAAINGVGTGAASAASNAVTPAVPVTVPGAPTIGSATGADSSAVVTWSVPGSDGGSAITGYVVTPYIGSVAQAAQTFVSTATTETVTGLANGTTYTFTVAAINGVGTGAASAASNAVTPAAVPTAPTIGSATGADSSAVVTWSVPGSDGGSAITGYVVTPSIGSVAQAAQTFSSTATTETVTGLANGTTYTFTVAAINGVGTGAASAASNAVTPAGRPSAPGFQRATPANASARVSWWPPSANGSPITGYTITPYVGGVAQAAQTFSSTANGETVTGLANGTAYTFTVAAINAVGTGVPSAPTAAVTPAPQAPSAPGFQRATPGNQSARVTWFPPPANGSPITGYTITPYVGGVAQAAQVFASAANVETVTGLTNGTAYTFTIAATNAVGTGAPSAPTAPVTPAPQPPSAPGFQRATAGNASATVSWWPGAANGSPITGYTITPYVGGVAQAAQVFASAASAETVAGLTNGTAYTFTIAATNVAGTGPPSAPTASVTPAPLPPGVPGFQRATAGNLSARVSWFPPSANGSPITGYTITPYVSGVAQAAQVFASAANVETVTGLTNGTAYTFTIAATNAVGTGAPSAPTAPVTPAPQPPSAPGFQRASAGAASATVSWWPPATNGSPITGYTITPYVSGVAQAPQTFATTANVDTVSGLTSGTTYTFTVTALSAAGPSTPSAPTNAVTPT